MESDEYEDFGKIAEMLPNKDFLEAHYQTEMILEKIKLFYERMDQVQCSDRLNFLIQSIMHLLADRDFFLTEEKSVFVKGKSLI